MRAPDRREDTGRGAGRWRVIDRLSAVDFITSLDSYGAVEGWPGWWGMESPEYLGWLGDSRRDLRRPGPSSGVPK